MLAGAGRFARQSNVWGRAVRACWPGAMLWLASGGTTWGEWAAKELAKSAKATPAAHSLWRKYCGMMFGPFPRWCLAASGKTGLCIDAGQCADLCGGGAVVNGRGTTWAIARRIKRLPFGGKPPSACDGHDPVADPPIGAAKSLRPVIDLGIVEIDHADQGRELRGLAAHGIVPRRDISRIATIA